MALLQRNIMRQQWLLFGLSLVFLVAYLARITPTCNGTEAEESFEPTHVSTSTDGRSKTLGENSDPPFLKYVTEPAGQSELLTATYTTDSNVPAIEVEAPTAKPRFTSTEEGSNQPSISALGDDAYSDATPSTDISSTSDHSHSTGPVPELRSSQETGEPDASAGLDGLNTEQDEDLHYEDNALISLPALTSPEGTASRETAPLPTSDNDDITVTSTTTVNPPASTSGFRGTNTFKGNAAHSPPRRRQKPASPPEGLVDLVSPFLIRPQQKPASPPEGLTDLLLPSTTYPTKVADRSTLRRSKSVDESSIVPYGRRDGGVASTATFAWPRYLQAKDLEDGTEDTSRKDPAQTCRRIEVLQTKVAERTSDFEAAAERACSPSSYAAYVDMIQNQMDGALGNLEDWIGQVTSGWLDSSFGYEDLRALLEDEITVWEYLKRNPIFLATVLVAIVLLFLWLFCCTPKICCRCCRRLCFCIPERVHKIGFMGRLVATVTGAVALLIVLVFAILAAASQYNGVGGVRALQCHLYSTMQEIINGSNTTTVDPNEQFVGVTPLFRDLKEVSAKLDTSSDQSIITDLRNQVNTDLDFSQGIAASKGYLTAVKEALTDPSNQIDTFYHVCQACEAVKPSQPVGTALNALQTTISSPDLDMSTKIDELFEQFAFPSIVLDDVFPVSEMEKALERAADTLAQAEPSVTSGLMYTDAAFGVAYAFVFLMACMGVAWLILFFFRGASTRSAPACVQWNVLCFSMVLILLVAGIIGFATNTALRGCEYVNKELVVNDKWNDLINAVNPATGNLSNLVTGCFGEASTGNLVDILGYREEYDAMIEQVNSALDDLVNRVPATPSITVQGAKTDKHHTELQIPYFSADNRLEPS